MNRIVLLEQLKLLTKEETADIIMPVSMQKGDTEQAFRAAEIYLMRLIKSTAAKKTAPYIIHQLITSKDIQPSGSNLSASTNVRSIFCVYNEDEQEGGLMLVNLMERMRIRLLKQVIIGGQFELDLEVGLESFLYPDDTAPYFAGEMISAWKIPAVKREVSKWL
ncbi:MAG TPA: hypothetical protein VN626_08075 [Clostridia bacterium]|nr:hypothetical protein [Clostridia bacterium]